MDNRFFNNNLELIIYTIGYAIEGESLLILVKADDFVVYSIVVDGYKMEGRNITVELLQNLSIQRIDMFCWTHPDRDHSCGINEYIGYMDRNTRIILGDGFISTREKWQYANPIMYDFIEKELEKSLNKKDRIVIRPVHTGERCKELKFVHTRTGMEYLFEVHIFAPSGYLNFRRNIREMGLSNNENAVGFDIRFGNIVAAFCSDVPNVVLRSISDEDFPQNIDFIKIPHHCSRSSDYLLKMITEEVDVACCTANKANHLPDRCLLREYSKKANRIFCTNHIDVETQNDFYGMIRTSIHILHEELMDTCLYGNAVEVLEDRIS